MSERSRWSAFFESRRRRTTLMVGCGCVLAAIIAASIVVSPAGCSSPSSDAPALDGGNSGEASKPNPTPTPDSDAGSLADGGAKPSLAAIYADNALWKLIPGTPNCGLYEGKVVPDPFPHRVWSSCGGAVGCKETRTAIPVDETLFANAPVAGGAFMNGDFYVLLDQFNPKHSLAHVARLSDGATVAAVLDRYRSPQSCVLTAGGGVAPLLFAWFGSAPGLGTRFGRASMTPGTPITWHPTWVDMPPMRDHFMSDDLYGAAVLGELLYLKPTDTAPRALDGPAQTAQGLGDQVLWTGVSSKSVHSFTQDAGAVDLIPITSPRDPIGTRMSNDKIVWAEGFLQGERHSDVHLHWSPRTTKPNEIVVHDSPLMTIFGCTLDMHVSDDWVATTGCVDQGMSGHPDTLQMFVWHLSTNEIFQIPYRPGRRFQRILGLSPTEILLADVPKDPAFRGTIDSLVRIELASLPAVIAAWK